MKRKSPWLLLVSSYLMQIPFLTFFICAMVNEEFGDSDLLVGIVVSLSCVFAFITLILCVINILSAVLRYDPTAPAPYKTTMTVKLCMIPFYIINFVIWGMFIVVCVSYPLFIAFGILLFVVSIISTYILVLSTGAHNIVYTFRDLKETKSPIVLLCLICHFMFCFDVIAAIILYKKLGV